MAYPTVSAPYGLKPINRVDGMPYAGATRKFAIANTAPAIYYGDLVQLSAGKVTRITSATPTGMVGVFLGCSYTNPTTKQPTWAQYWPANSAITDAQAIVVDDPMAAFKIVVTNASSVVVNTTTIVSIGYNIGIDLGSGGSTSTGDSTISALAGSEDTVNTLPLRVIDVVPDTATSTGYPEIIVKINLHQYNNTTGVS